MATACHFFLRLLLPPLLGKAACFLSSSDPTSSDSLKKGERDVILLLAFLMALFCAGPGEGQSPFVQSTWRDTIYFRATYEAAEAGQALFHVAAVDSYEVFFNGDPVGSDSVWTRMAAYEVAVQDGDNEIAVQVVNRGRGDGNGMIAALVAEDSLLMWTTTNRRVQAWLWTAQSLEGTDWRTTDVEDEEGWQAVQEGTADAAQVEGVASVGGVPLVIAGLPNGVDAGSDPAGVVLKRVRGVNLALEKPSNRPEVTDGDLSVGWNAPQGGLSFTASVDLQDRQLLNKVRVTTQGSRASQLAANSLRGYSVQVSDDQIRWTEVGSRLDIGCKPGLRSPCAGSDVDPSQYNWTQVTFKAIWTRFVRFVIVDINPGSAPRIAEFEVFGGGFAEDGFLMSRPLHLGVPALRKNFGRVRWSATVPDRTELTVRFRTGDTVADFADPEEGWSASDTSGAWFPAPEPERLLQYRVDMHTEDLNVTPRFEHLEIDYDTEIAASSAFSRITPNQVSMGEDTLFVYNLDLDFDDGDLGVERLRIAVPGMASIVEGAPVNDLLAFPPPPSRQYLTLTFAEPLQEGTQLQIPFRTRLHASSHQFRASLFSPGSQNPLNVTADPGIDPETGDQYTWAVASITAPEKVLSDVSVSAPVITPNGDGVNDVTVIGFTLSKVDTPRHVSVQVFDLGGRLVRDLRLRPLAAGAYTGLGAPGTWDGTDAAGNVVPPGLYLFRVDVDFDTGNEVKSGVIAVVY